MGYAEHKHRERFVCSCVEDGLVPHQFARSSRRLAVCRPRRHRPAAYASAALTSPQQRSVPV
jgi:hypothetical protein